VILAFTSARFAAMGFNRIVDRDIDARNPRTASRELPSGKLALGQAVAAVVIAALIFVLSAANLNALCLALSPLALAAILFYSYTKRFTSWSHLVLGLSLGIAPAGGYLAITGEWSAPWWMLVSLTAAVAAWVGGFDILYSLQDLEFDKRELLHSIPARVGEARAFALARALHVLSVVALAAVGFAVRAGPLYAAGVAVVALLLLYEHSLVGPGDHARLDAAFFKMNGVISLVFFGFVLLERLL
jgi:4-hydroxybenzoate polyprenyltransferase